MPLVNQSSQIETAFVEQFESEIKHDYQRMGSKMLNTVRRKTNIRGTQTSFHRVGISAVGKKSRHGTVPINNSARTRVSCPVEDYYTGDFVDKLDELKIMHDERGAIQQSLAAAMGRQSDDLIIAEADNFTNATSGTGGLTLAKVEGIFTFFGNNNVPDDGRRVLWVSPAGWVDLMQNPEFSNADYIPPAELPYPKVGFGARQWFSFLVMQHSGLLKAGNTRTCLAYHQSALGHGSAQSIYTDITWQGPNQAWLIVLGMSEGAVLIDDLGGYKLLFDETAA